MELISMTNFVKKMNNSESKGINALIVEYGKIVDYAKFLQQPLKLGMFVPCDENGIFLEKPTNYDEWLSQSNRGFDHDYEALVQKKYKKAKEKVLFENLSYKFGMIGIEKEKGWSSLFDLDFRPNSTVEDLLTEKFSYQLTESAIKKIGL